MDKLPDLLTRLEDNKASKGFEFHPFKVKWYNRCVQPVFNLPYQDDALCMLVISIPKMFECTLKPFIIDQYSSKAGLDPVDQCMHHEFGEMQQILKEHETEYILDFELLPTRRPKILVQTAGHVSGAAFYYQKQMISNPPWEENKKIYGVSMHPKYGGWFAFRGVIVFKNLLMDETFHQTEPVNCVGGEEKIIELLNRFNGNWQDWSYRDVTTHDIIDRYSDEQKEYFDTLPQDRRDLVEKWCRMSS